MSIDLSSVVGGVVNEVTEVTRDIVEAAKKRPLFIVKNYHRTKQKLPYFEVKNIGDCEALDVTITSNISLQFQPFTPNSTSFKKSIVQPQEDFQVYYQECVEEVPDIILLKIKYQYKRILKTITESKNIEVKMH